MSAEVLKTYEEKMKKSLDNLGREFGAIRAGRANPAILDRVVVDYYGVPTQIQQMAAISVAEARILLIQPWDKTTLKAIEKALQIADIGINPQNDGEVIRLVFPPLTEERRKEIVKGISKTTEECKVAIRSIRRDANEKIKSMKKDNALTEDDMKNFEKKIQDFTDKYCKEADNMGSIKEKEILSI